MPQSHTKVRLCDHGATYSSTTHGTLCEVNCTRLKQTEILAEFSNHPLPTLNLLELYLPLPTLNLLELYHPLPTLNLLELYHPLPTPNLLELYHPPSLLDCPEWANGVRTYTVLQLYFC